jgi:anion-transporting  ArsA/GET3 family ATPase
MSLSRQLHFVSGKGGVGKSTVSCALALLFREQGHRVLLAQVHAPKDSHAHLLGWDEVPHEVEELEEGLFAVNATPENSLREYGLMTLKYEALYKVAFENRIMRSFLRFVPSLAELTMLGKLWFHAQEKRDDGRPRFDRIVVDCPSTGHGLGFLRVSQIVRNVSRSGPLADKAAEMAAVIEAPERSALHVVTLPEDMPTNETLSFIAEVRRTGVAPLGHLMVNSVISPAFGPAVREELERAVLAEPSDATSPAARELRGVVQRRLLRDELVTTQLERLREPDVGLDLIELPHLLRPSFGREEISLLAERMGAAS